MTPRRDHIFQARLLSLFLAGLLVTVSIFAVMTAPVMAAGRTYVPQNEVVDQKNTHELCRLSKRRIEEGKTKCIYKRQSGGNDTVITMDGTNNACQREYRCKREN